MWTREQLKQNAKGLLARYYWMGFLVCLIGSILSGGISASTRPRVNFEYNFNSGYHFNQYYGDSFFGYLTGILAGALVFGSVILFLYNIFIGNLLEVGKNRFFMESRWHPSKLTTLFAGFKGNYWNTVSTLFVRQIFIFLWSLLLVVPGIIKAYEYRLVPYLLAENPNMDRRRAFELSRILMDGEKMNLFVLDLSFIGWFFLGGLACGIGIWFVNPYYEATIAEFYACMRTKAFSTGVSNATELPDFNYCAMP